MSLGKKNRIYAVLATTILLFALFLAGCASKSDSSDNGNGVPATGNGPKVGVQMTSYKFQADTKQVPAGPVTFHVKNAAPDQEHEMVLLKTDLPGSQLPTKPDGLVDEDKLESMGEVEVGQGEAKDLSVTLTPGHYVLLCNEPGHYKNNMYLDITAE